MQNITQYVICWILLVNSYANAYSLHNVYVLKRSHLKMQQQSTSVQTPKNRPIVSFITAAAIFASYNLQAPAVIAANYGGFGSTYSEVVNPKDAVLNEELSSTDDVKSGLSGLQALKSTIINLKADLAKDSQIDILSRIKKELNPGAIRTVLNKYNTAFSEDTQRGTDRLIRNFIQDITELQREAFLKEGKARAPSKVALAEKRLDAAEKALLDLEAFYPKDK